MPVTEPINRQTCDAYLQRLAGLEADTPRRFGSMEPRQMIAHLHRAFAISLGEFDPPFVGNWFTKTGLFKWFVIDAPLPWPKGRIKAPPSFTPAPPADGDVQGDLGQLAAIMHRFAAAADEHPDAPGGISPILGPLPCRRWAKLHGRHVDHHCRQFGV
jgi:hypothetical protein